MIGPDHRVIVLTNAVSRFGNDRHFLRFGRMDRVCSQRHLIGVISKNHESPWDLPLA